MELEQKLGEVVKKVATVSKVATATGIDYQTLNRCLNGEQRLKADEFLAVCKVLNLNPLDYANE